MGKFADMLTGFRLEPALAQAPAITVLALGFFRRGFRILGAQDHQYLSELGRLGYILTTSGTVRIPQECVVAKIASPHDALCWGF